MAVNGEDEPLLPRNVLGASYGGDTQPKAMLPEDGLGRSQWSGSLMRHPLFLTLGAAALIVAGVLIRTGTLNSGQSSSSVSIRVGETASDTIIIAGGNGKQRSSFLQEGSHGEAGWLDVASGGVADSAGSGRDRESWRSAPKNPPGVGGKMEERDERSVGRTRKPNVFVFLIDDMGFDDIGYQSTDLSNMTPNLDALAEGGIKLSNYYSMALCTPARASLMTGRYPVRYGMQYGIIMAGAPWGLPLNEKVLPEYMNDAGYESHMVGKWHLGSYNDASLPSRRGFKTYLGYLNGKDNYYTHKSAEAYLDDDFFYDFGFGNETGYYDITPTGDGMACAGLEPSSADDATSPTDYCYVGTYSTDAFLSRAHQVVKEKTPWDEEPLFLYVAHQSVHAPVGPAPSDGFTEAEHALLGAMGEDTDNTRRVAFAGVLMYLDKRIGEFIDFLEAGGWLENSIIVVASDNGGCPDDGGSNYPLRGVKQSMFEGGTRVPAFVYSRSHIPQDLWGTTYSKMMHVTDWVPTLASAVGGEILGSAGALDGVDHWNSLLGIGEAGDSTNGPRNEMLYNWDPYRLSSSYELTENHNRTQGAFRQGKWKLLVNVFCSGYYSHHVAAFGTDSLLSASVACGDVSECQDCGDGCESDTAYLFGDRLVNLAEDPREENNLIFEYPEIASMLRARTEEIVFSEWTSSNYKEINVDSYQVWKAHDWWMVPWVDYLSPEL